MMFDYLSASSYCYEEETSGTQTLFKFKDNEYRGLIGVPHDENNNFWYKYFVKGDKESYARHTPLEDLPGWFFDLVIQTSELVHNRDRLPKLFVENKKKTS
jgi:hypothetical protein